MLKKILAQLIRKGGKKNIGTEILSSKKLLETSSRKSIKESHWSILSSGQIFPEESHYLVFFYVLIVFQIPADFCCKKTTCCRILGQVPVLGAKF